MMTNALAVQNDVRTVPSTLSRQLRQFGLNPNHWMVVKSQRPQVFYVIHRKEHWFRFKARVHHQRIWDLVLDVEW